MPALLLMLSLMRRPLATMDSRAHLEAKHAPKERPMLMNSQEIWIILQLVTLHFVPSDRSKAFGDEHLNPSLRVKEMIALKGNCPQIMKQVEL